MIISRATLTKAVEAHIISVEQANALIDFLQHNSPKTASFNLTNILYYFGGLLAIGAMSLFMNLGWELYGGWGIFFICLCYAVIGLCLAALFEQKNYAIPAGICATFVIVLTPLAIYGLQQGMGWWPDNTHYRDYHYLVKWHWVFMEFGTLIVGIILAWIYRYPFMMMPIAVTLWYMSMDLTQMLTGGTYDWELSAKVSMYFGFLVLLIAFWVDLLSRHSDDYAFWLYLFGVLAFWGGLTSQHSNSELGKFIYFMINIVLIGIGVLLVRRIFVIMGGLGCSIYLGHLAWQVFKDSMLFPFTLTLIGLLIIYLGTLWQRHEAWLTQQAQALLPTPLRELLQARIE